MRVGHIDDRRRLQVFGEAINYNAYGESDQDVHITALHLYEIMIRYANPLDLLRHESIGQELNTLRESDFAQASNLKPFWEGPQGRAFLLPDEPWSRRVIGTLINTLATGQPQRAHAVFRPAGVKDFLVSVRSPLHLPYGAEVLCRQFGGDGRAGAAGIDRLPAEELDRFLTAYSDFRWGQTASGNE